MSRPAGALPFQDRTGQTFSDLGEIPVEQQQHVVEYGGAKLTIGHDSAEVDLDPTASRGPRQSQGHDENMAEAIGEAACNKIAQKVLEWVQADEAARAPWKQRIDKALSVMGIDTLSESDEDSLPGSSKLTHPMIAEACVQFQARAIEELFPAAGPVKAYVEGEATPELTAQAERVEAYMNYHLTKRDRGYFEDKDQALFVLPAYGSVFQKVCKDPITGVETSRQCAPGSVLVPYNATSLETAARITHQFAYSRNDYKRAVAAGFYRDVQMTQAPPVDGNDSSRQLQDKSDDRQASEAWDDDNRTFFECHAYVHLDGLDDEDEPAPPYIITVDKDSQKVVAIRRGWKEGDEAKTRRMWFVQHRYLPGFGVYGFGLLHVIGVLAMAAGGALRAVLDAAAGATFQGGFKAKGNRMAGDLTLERGTWIDTDMTAEELKSGFYTPPFKEPSPALFQTLEFLVNSGKQFASITEAMVGEAATGGPVGTIMAIIEQGSKVFSGIHKRLHNTQGQEYEMLMRLIAEGIPEVYPYKVKGGMQRVLKQDFNDQVNVMPVSDPSIISSTQRIALAQATLELIKQQPDLFDVAARRKATHQMLVALKNPLADELLPEAPFRRLDPVTENMVILTGKPVHAFMEQDHQSHIRVHEMFMAGLPPQMQQVLTPIMMAHNAEHEAYLYRQNIEHVLGPLPPADLNKDLKDVPEQIDAMIARAVAQSGASPPAAGSGPPGAGGSPQAAAQMKEMGRIQEQVVRERQQLVAEKNAIRAELGKLDTARANMDSDHRRQMGEIEARVRDMGFIKVDLKNQADSTRVELERIRMQVDTRLERMQASGEAIIEKLQGMETATPKAVEARDKAVSEIRDIINQAAKLVAAGKTKGG